MSGCARTLKGINIVAVSAVTGWKARKQKKAWEQREDGSKSTKGDTLRDPERIDRILTKLGEAWHRAPEWRLGQLVSNLQGPGLQDVFHPEDEQWEAWLDTFIEEAF